MYVLFPDFPRFYYDWSHGHGFLHCSAEAQVRPDHISAKHKNTLVNDVFMGSFPPISGTHFSNRQTIFIWQPRIVFNRYACSVVLSSFSWMCLSKKIPSQWYYWHQIQAKLWPRWLNIWWKKEFPQDCLLKPLKTQHCPWSINNCLRVSDSFKEEHPKQQMLKMLLVTFQSIPNNKCFC